INLLDGIGLDVSGASAAAFASGDLVVLHQLRADSISNDDSVSWEVLVGAETSTPPRYDGSETFAFVTSAGTVLGSIDNGRLRARFGELVVRIPFFPGQHPVALSLAAAQVEVELTAAGCHGVVGGAVRDLDVTAVVLPELAAQAVAHMQANPDHEDTLEAVQFFDRNGDGEVTPAEVIRVVRDFAPPDVHLDDDSRLDALSFGFGFSCVRATLEPLPL
ncbi:MAG TPA: hypothetical protein VM734_00770, partial [Kofleriaceae bacterium]|nr:hypothetical protein [Kofleriaceae bacterium]